MRLAVLSSLPDKKCGLADYTYPLVHEFRKSKEIERVIAIGDLESTKADYLVDFKSIALYKKVSEIIARESIDMLFIGHEYWIYGKTNLGFILVHYKLDVPTATWFSVITSTDPGVSLPERIRAKLVEKLVSRKAERIVVNTGVNPEQLVNFPKEKIVEIPLGISPNTRSEKAQKDKRAILFFGIISPHKGVENLIESSRYLKNIKMVIAGRPNMDTRDLLSLKAELSRFNEIVLDLDWISPEKKEQYFSTADLVALPYTRIGLQSGVLYDSLSYGLPCIASRGSMMGGVVEKYCLGEVVNPLDPADIARGINDVLNDYGRYQNNVFKYQQIASWENVAKIYMKLFKEILEDSQQMR